MTNSAQARTNVLGLLGIVLLSSATMLWLLWHFPVSTGIATVSVLSAFGLSARLARWIEPDGLTELDSGNQSA